MEPHAKCFCHLFGFPHTIRHTMTTFQAIIYGIVHGFTQFLPLSSEAHHLLLPYFLDWPAVEGYFSGTLALSAFLALLVYFRHDWASIISGFLQVILLRKRPMTLDERLPFFIITISLPPAIAWYYFNERLAEIQWQPLLLAGVLVVIAIAFTFFDSFSRKNRGMSDWNWTDALILGVLQILAFVPGAGIQAGALIGSLSRNYNREAAGRFTCFVITPLLGASAFYQLRGFDFHAGMPAPDLSWLSLVTAFLVAFFSGLLAIGGFLRTFQKRGLGTYATYRWLLAAAVGVVYWLRLS